MTVEETIRALAPELTRPRPRPVQPTATWRAQRYYGPLLVALALGALAALVYFLAVRPMHLLHDHGVVTEGRVIGLDIHRGKNTEYCVRYRFTDENLGAHESDWSVSKREFAALRAGGSVDVTYLPGDPSLSRPWRISPQMLARTDHDVTVLGLVFGLIGLVAIALFERAARLHWSLAESGEPTIATVVKRSTYTNKGATTYFATYEFADTHGQMRRRRARVPQAVYEAVLEGQGLVILFDPEWPKRSLPYASLTVKVAVSPETFA